MAQAQLVEGGAVEMKKMTKKWLVGVAVSVLIVFLALGWLANQQLSLIFLMTNQVYQETKSPDGRYVATLAYRDGQTFGYYFVTLQPAVGWHKLGPDDPIPVSEVAETAAEGVEGVAWKGAHTLVVTYDTSGSDAAQFVRQQKSWHEVTIIYRGISLSAGSKNQ